MSIISASTTTTTAYQVTADTTGTLVLKTGASPTTAITIDGSQNVGLGVTPSAWSSSWKVFQTNNGFSGNATSNNFVLGGNHYSDSGGTYRYITNAAANQYQLAADGSHFWRIAPSGTAGNPITFTQAMTLDASGNLLVGTTTAQGALTVQGSTSGAWASFCINTSSTGVGSYTRGGGGSASYPLAVWAQYDGTERARIDSSGNLLVGTTSIGGVGITMQPSTGNIIQKYSGTGTNTMTEFKNNNGTVGYISSSGTTTSYVTSSDYRLKENITPMTGALATVTELKPVTYTWKTDGSAGQGFIAHELQAVVPDAVVGEKDAVDEENNPKYQGIDTSFLVATLTAAIQELKAIVDAQAVEIAALKG